MPNQTDVQTDVQPDVKPDMVKQVLETHYTMVTYRTKNKQRVQVNSKVTTAKMLDKLASVKVSSRELSFTLSSIFYPLVELSIHKSHGFETFESFRIFTGMPATRLRDLAKVGKFNAYDILITHGYVVASKVSRIADKTDGILSVLELADKDSEVIASNTMAITAILDKVISGKTETSDNNTGNQVKPLKLKQLVKVLQVSLLAMTDKDRNTAQTILMRAIVMPDVIKDNETDSQPDNETDSQPDVIKTAKETLNAELTDSQPDS